LCTVTYIPSVNGFFLTSNRDEKNTRKNALAPLVYRHGTIALAYPKDADAGGTWIAVAQNGNAAVLLNGAFKKHITMPPYRKSRGIVFIDLIASEDPYWHFLNYNLDNIEPFTIVLYCHGRLYECRWDGQSKHQKILNPQQPHIWSSVTLYEEPVVKKREQWFLSWIKNNISPSQNDILQFHQFTGDGDVQNDLLMNRDNCMLTVSITGIEWKNDSATIQYSDLLKKEQSVAAISFCESKHFHES